MNKTATATVIVITSKGEKIVTYSAEARKLLKAGQAKVIQTEPFTLVLLDKEMERQMVAKKEAKKGVVVSETAGAVASGNLTTNLDQLNQLDNDSTQNQNAEQSFDDLIKASPAYVDNPTDFCVTNMSLYESFICSDIVIGTGDQANYLAFEPGVVTNLTKIGLAQADLVKSPQFVELYRSKKILIGRQPSPEHSPHLYKKNPMFVGNITEAAKRVAEGDSGTMAEVRVKVKDNFYLQELKKMEEEELARNAKVGTRNPLENYKDEE